VDSTQDLYTHSVVFLLLFERGVVAKPGIATGSRSNDERLVLEDTRGSRVQLTIGLEPCQNRSLRPHFLSISVTGSVRRRTNENLTVLATLVVPTEWNVGYSLRHLLIQVLRPVWDTIRSEVCNKPTSISPFERSKSGIGLL
jgi:hypothetical protein